MIDISSVLMWAALSFAPARAPSPEVMTLSHEIHALRVQVERMKLNGTLNERVSQIKRRRL